MWIKLRRLNKHEKYRRKNHLNCQIHNCVCWNWKSSSFYLTWGTTVLSPKVWSFLFVRCVRVYAFCVYLCVNAYDTFPREILFLHTRATQTDLRQDFMFTSGAVTTTFYLLPLLLFQTFGLERKTFLFCWASKKAPWLLYSWRLIVLHHSEWFLLIVW